jgi:hypothetical protein
VQLDESSTSYAAIRGREQQLIDYYVNLGTSANRINGISPLNANFHGTCSQRRKTSERSREAREAESG